MIKLKVTHPACFSLLFVMSEPGSGFYRLAQVLKE
jgi:hypothetical protein